MNKYFIFFCILVFILFSCMSRTIGPKLRVNNELIDIGVLNFHDSMKLKYILSNYGDNSLEIKSVGTSCGCSRAILSDSTIKPGGKVELQIGFTATDTGRFKKHVVLETNSDTIYKTLTFTGYILKK